MSAIRWSINTKPKEPCAHCDKPGVWNKGDVNVCDGHRQAVKLTANRRSWPFLAWDGEGVTRTTFLKQISNRQREVLACEKELMRCEKPRCVRCRDIRKLKNFIAKKIDRAVMGDHKYILLANSKNGYLINEKGISTGQALSFIADEAKRYPGHIHVMYGGSYDANMILGDISREEAHTIWSGQAINIRHRGREFEIQYRQRKALQIRERDTEKPWVGKTYKANWKTKVTIWDVLGFFQYSFLQILEEWLPDYPHLKLIEKGKKQRQQFHAKSIENYILPYTLAECDALEKLMHKFRNSMYKANLILDRWDGAGAAAATLLKREGVKNHISQPDPEMERIFAHAYFGGRVEISHYGNASQTAIHHYDINSAYPAAMLDLPSMMQGRWIRGYNDDPQSFTLCKIRWHSKPRAHLRRWYPFPYRDALGSITFPYEGEGWYWLPEILAAFETVKKHTVDFEILKAYTWRTPVKTKPFSFVPEIFAQRNELKSQRDHAQLCLKLAINSLYGKAAQTLGGTDIRKPPYHNLAWAGYITSATRAAMLRAIMQAPDDVLMAATDGLYSRKKLLVPIGKELGQWDYKKHDGITIVQSGIYWLRNGDSWQEFRRGCDEGSISREGVLEAWRTRRKRYIARSTRFVTFGTALAGADTWQLHRKWRTIPREIALGVQGTKRWELEGKTIANPSTQLVGTWPAQNMTPGAISAPYPIPWRADISANIEMDDLAETKEVDYEELESEI